MAERQLPGPEDTVLVDGEPMLVQALDGAAHAILHDPHATGRERGMAAAILALIDERTQWARAAETTEESE